MTLENPQSLTELLESWREAGWIRALDLAFARFIDELGQEQGENVSPLLLLLATLTSHQVGRGHVCIELNQLLDKANHTLALPPDDDFVNDCPTPAEVLNGASLKDCTGVLNSSSAVGAGSEATPLVLAGSRLYLRRYWRYEQEIAAGIQQRLASPTPLQNAQSPQANTLASALNVLFPQQPETDFQKVACALAARQRFGVITGGPGTGKTTTVVRLLAALQAVASTADADRKHRIRLAAPTGKAAARLNESIAGAVNRLPLDQLPGQVTGEDIPGKVTTLHRLLGSRPDTRRFRHNPDNPLLVDVLVIDEASMVDVELMAAVFAALPARAQIILLGDKDQLASVDAGAVLGELCRRADEAHYTRQTATWLEAITGYRIPEPLRDDEGFPLDQAVAMLRKSYRFTQDSGIRVLADAVNRNGLTDHLLHQWANRGFPDVAWLNGNRPQGPEQTQSLVARHALTGSPEAFGENRSTEAAAVGYGHYLNLIRNHGLTAESPVEEWNQLAGEVLAAFGRFQILCALRKGPWGVEGINQMVARQLQQSGLIAKTEGWYPGRPVLITANDYNLGLMNGDVGITLEVPWDKTEEGDPKPTLRVIFPAGDGTADIRWISPSRLQQLETVYAMTVHKSQGSEFEHCSLILPDRLSPVITRELIYTGITRARSWFSLITGNRKVLTEGVKQKVIRASGLLG